MKKILGGYQNAVLPSAAFLALFVGSCGCVLAQAPRGGPEARPPRRGQAGAVGERGRLGPQDYTLEQAMSDNAQLHTIAFNGLAFITGDFGASTFLPPGKVCDFFGFQYMRDIDAAHSGHNPKFLDRVAANVLSNLSAANRQVLEEHSRTDAKDLETLAMMRLPLIKAFWRELTGDIPAGSSGLNQSEVKRYVGDIFAYDAELAYKRAQVYGAVTATFKPEQKAYFGRMKFGDFNSWPEVDMEQYKLPRGSEKLVNVAYMTYASELFSWYAGSVDADVYFCPERHGTYFGGFYMKDMPAMGKRDFNISTSVTGDSGRDFIAALNQEQQRTILAIPNQQRKTLAEVAEVRRAISVELRKFLTGGAADKAKVIALGRRYGELDGEMSCLYATAFASINRTLTNDQREKLRKLRNLDGYASAPAYLYSDALRSDVTIPSTDHFFAPTKSGS